MTPAKTGGNPSLAGVDLAECAALFRPASWRLLTTGCRLAYPHEFVDAAVLGQAGVDVALESTPAP